MKIFFSLPKSGEGEQFYNRYASLVPTLNLLGYLAQVVSALTEFGIIYSIVYSSLAPLWPDTATKAALMGAAVGTLVLEVGLRKFAPYSARAIIHKRFKSWDGWITGFVLAATAGLFITSGLLSFGGSRLLVKAVAPEPVVITTAVADSTQTERLEQTRQLYSELIAATEQAAAADILELDAAYTRLIEREARTGKRFNTLKSRNRQKIEAVQSGRTRKIAEHRKAKVKALQAIRTEHSRSIDELNNTNKEAANNAAAMLDSYGGNLGYFTIFCLAIFMAAVTIKELHHAGSGISEQVEPGGFDFEAGPVTALTTALKARVERLAYGVIHRIEKGTTDAPEPVAAPTVWKRNRDGLKHSFSKDGVTRKTNSIKVAPAAKRREIGFNQPASIPMKSTDAKNALTLCVKDASQDAKKEAKIGACLHCGNSFAMRTTWQKFCATECRKAHHAEQHGGVPFDPTHKPWKNG